jgi:crotonobetainyl-CoA:carnitine CoA-transferase CaiB-like acyl-CoA transferase
VTARVLDDIRVIDLGRYVAAPYCAMILADMGADVIRVERPGGEDDRHVGLVGQHGENFMFPALARGKKAITLDMRRPRGHELLLELVSRSDVVVHNFSPAAARALRLTYDDMRAARPDIIYTAVSCFGEIGPDADRPGFDPIAQVASGSAAVTGLDGEPPLRAGVPWVDYSTGLSGALGTVLALRQRDRTGEGQAVNCALLRTAISYMAPMIGEAIVAGQPRPRLGNRAPYFGPTDLYRCRDGYVYIACVTDGAWRSLMTIVGRPELTGDRRLCTQMDRFEQRAWLDDIVRQWMAERTAAEVVDALDRGHVPCGVSRSLTEAAENPQVEACGMLPRVDLSVPGMAAVPASATPFSLSRMPPAPIRRSPRVGEDSDEIFCGLLGLSDADLASMRSDGIV